MDGGGRQWPFSHRPRLLLIPVIRPRFFSAFSTAPDLPCFIRAAVPRLLQQWPRTNPILPSSSVAVIYARQTCSVTLSSPLLSILWMACTKRGSLTVGRRFLLGRHWRRRYRGAGRRRLTKGAAAGRAVIFSLLVSRTFFFWPSQERSLWSGCGGCGGIPRFPPP